MAHLRAAEVVSDETSDSVTTSDSAWLSWLTAERDVNCSKWYVAEYHNLGLE